MYFVFYSQIEKLKHFSAQETCVSAADFSIVIMGKHV
jgi:hypothetical protein